ncbi:hypothetical protein LAZ67_15000244 [Cordylochernes scorpioides]|uniref:Uncharacterized protein n=1 Tax=Cordylochernes scorpioides TaxID=51811 RepID=A0ABY6L9X5_9ARAC|nr:hypothetical protein LAZ67_15000244 [Cordylochernes scorpioides]
MKPKTDLLWTHNESRWFGKDVGTLYLIRKILGVGRGEADPDLWVDLGYVVEQVCEPQPGRLELVHCAETFAEDLLGLLGRGPQDEGHTLLRSVPVAVDILAQLKSGHLKTMTFQNGWKVFPLCTKCNSQPAIPKHIIDCIDSSIDELYLSPADMMTELFKRVSSEKIEQKRMSDNHQLRQFQQTDDFMTKGMKIGLRRAGWSIGQISTDRDLDVSTVHRLWWLEQGHVA